MEADLEEELGEWVRLEQAHGDYVYVRGSLVVGIGETGGEKGVIAQYVTLINGNVYATIEQPSAVVQRIRAAVAAERKLTR